MNTFLTLAIFVISFLGLHFGLGVVAWLAVLIAFVLAVLGCVLIVVVLDGDGSPW